ncbi:MAG: peptidase [Bdellovibrionales bacterium]|nr:peptidase [Bdellovibrionales bacterium]
MGSKKRVTEQEQIIIDKDNDLVFASEEDVLEYFAEPISHFEAEYLNQRTNEDFSDDESFNKEEELEELLQSPDEVWEDSESLKDITVYNFIKAFHNEEKDEVFYYIAVAYLAEDVPTFVFLHFPTRFDSVCEHYRRGDLVFDRSREESESGGIEGDALSEGDELALGLYKSMLIVRSPNDIEETLFQNYAELREDTIEEADEIWRNTTLSGYTLVTFIKDFSRAEEGAEHLYYLAVTLEDEGTNSHALMFSFPTNDETLVDRYRHGENLQAEEVIQESSH